MSVNLMDLVKGAVGSQMGPLAGILGESEQKTQSLLGAAVPAILGGLMNKSSSSDGANEIFKTLDDHDGGILDNLGGLLGGGNHTGLLNQGSGLLGMIFGNRQSTMITTIAKMLGLGDSKITTALSLLAPIVMGVIGKQRRSQNLDVGGLTGLLADQKTHLSGHMPGELSDSLGLGNIFGAGADAVQGAGQAAAHGAQAAGRAAQDAGRAATDAGGGLFKMLLPLLILGAIAFLGYQFLFKNPPAAPTLDDVAISTPEISMPKIDLPGFDTGAINDTFGGLTDAVKGIKDEASAQLVIPQLEKTNTMLDGLGLADIATGPDSEAVSGLFGGLLTKLRDALDTAYAIPGVKGILEPYVTPLLEKLAVFGL